MKQQTKNNTNLSSLKNIALTLSIVFISFTAEAQEYDKWSLDLGFGIHQIGAPLTNGYAEKSIGQGSLGARYMFNERFGLRLDLGYNKFENTDTSLPFSSNYYRATLEGVVNLGNILKFNSWTNRINLLAHGGLGVAVLNTTVPVVSGNDFMTTLSVGVTPQFQISNRIAVFADFSSFIHFGQENTFNGGLNTASRESNISLFNTSIGVNISFGRYRTLADFYYEDETPESSELEKIKQRLATAEKEIADLKVKESSPNKELIMTELDARYVKKDEVNKYADVVTGGNIDFIRELLNRGYINVYFDVNKSSIQEGSLNSVNYLKQFMMDNPSVSADLIGYADETGSLERNKTLSQQRAKRVFDVLVAAGISASRLSYFGGGEDPSVRKEARQFARKVTFKIR